MLTLGNLLCLLLGFSLPLFLLLLAFRRGFRPLAAASAYRNASWKLGMVSDTRGISLQGHLGSRRLFVGEVAAQTTRGRPVIRGVLDFEYPLGLGLSLRSNAAPARPWRRSPPPSLSVNDATLDRQLSVRSLAPDLTTQLFTEEVRKELNALLQLVQAVSITDHWIEVRLATHPASDTALLHLVHQMERLARCIERVRVSLRCPEHLQDVASQWGSLTVDSTLKLLPSMPAIHGLIEGHNIRVVCVQSEGALTSDIILQFPEHPITGVKLRPHREDAPSKHSGQDIVLGDPTFDDVFIVQGFDPSTIRHLFPEACRQTLLDLARFGKVMLNDRQLTLAEGPTSPDDLEEALECLAAVAGSLQWPQPRLTIPPEHS